ncbi:hypothetical protein [Halobellus rubicundus]|uniref:Sodium/phosphate symporter n=1 Tax=Halobellus rubicundus TaxID=2996466 RepID=A0ABD5MFL0_9EURY
MSSRRHQVGLAIVALLGVALAFRAGPLYWSQYPSTLDGFNYAASAQTAMDTGTLGLTGRADNLFFTAVFAVAGLVFDTPALRVTQPAATVIGTGICLVGVAIARRAVKESATVSVSASAVALVVAGLLAVEGLFLRRTTVPDSDLVGILFTLLVAVSLQYAYRTGRRRWYGISGLFLVIFPILHTFTSFVVGLVITGLTARHVSRRLSLRSLVGGVVIAGGFWAYMAIYYRTAETSLSLAVPYVDRVTAYPGLFVAWAIVLVVGIVWLQHTSLRIRRAIYLGTIGAFFLVVALNAFTPIYPGTASTPQIVLALVALLAFVALSAAVSLDLISEGDGGTILLALFLSPAVIIGFSLTASLTAEYFATAMRAQTFLHFPVVAVAGVTLARLLSRDGSSGVRRFLRLAIVVVVVVATVTTAPLAFVNMDTGSVPSTTLGSEYESVEFVSTEYSGAWTTDHSLSRVGGHTFGANVSVTPTASWLSGGPSPRCAVLSQQSWTTTGAHLFPSGPETVPSDVYREWTGSRNVVYTAGGLDPTVVSLPRSNATVC